MEEEVSDDDTESSDASEDDELAYAGNEVTNLISREIIIKRAFLLASSNRL